MRKNRMVLSSIKQKKTIDLDISKKILHWKSRLNHILYVKNIIAKKYC